LLEHRAELVERGRKYSPSAFLPLLGCCLLASGEGDVALSEVNVHNLGAEKIEAETGRLLANRWAIGPPHPKPEPTRTCAAPRLELKLTAARN